MNDNLKVTVELKQSQIDYLARMTKLYDLDDSSKALRCLINYAIEERGREKEIFEEIRCLDC
jgi:hypothetical protein